MVWNPGTKSVTEIDMPSKKDFASFIKWSSTSPVLAIGTEKGSLVFFNKQNQRKIPCVGKHGKKVTTGCWNSEGILITGAEDNILTVSNSTGDTVCDSFIVKGSPVQLEWARPKKAEVEENKSSVEKEVSAIIKKKILILLNVDTTHNVEVTFSTQYGKIIDYRWFGDGYVAASFTNGIVSIISTHKSEIGSEVQSLSLFNSSIEAMIVNESLGKMAVAASGVIKIINMNDWSEIKSDEIKLDGDIGRIISMSWTDEGQILTVSTSNGAFFGFLMVIPSLCSPYDTNVAMLSTLSSVAIKDCLRNNATINQISLDIEPSFLALGKVHCAVGINNSVWYYRWRDDMEVDGYGRPNMVCKREYFSSIKQIVLNDKWTAVLSEGKCTLHIIEADQNGGNSDDRKFPQYESDKPIKYINLTDEFLIMIDISGKLTYYLIEENTVLLSYSPDNPIEKIFPNKSGTKCVCIDNTGCGFLYNPVDDSLSLIPNFSATVTRVIWDTNQTNMFITYDKGKINTYLYMQTSLDGPTILHIPRYASIEDLDKNLPGVETKISKDISPVLLRNGYCFTHSPVEGLRGEYLSTHAYVSSDKDGKIANFLQNMAIHRFSECFKIAEQVDDELSQTMYEALGKYALKQVELTHAENAFRLNKNVGMVYAINSIKDETEKYILMGHIASILHKHDIAQGFFLKSSRPELALEMRCDLQDWYTALKLVQNIDPSREPYICRKLAVQIENQGNSVEALKLFERALLNEPLPELEGKYDIKEHNMICYAGIARSSIKNGDTHRGLSIAKELTQSTETSENDTEKSRNSMLIEIGNVFEQVKQYSEAAQIFEQSGLYEKAATLYIQTGQFRSADKLIPKINSPAILTNIAKAKEAEGQFKEAEEIYEKANNYESIIRLNLEVLDNFQKARMTFKQKSQTPHCAKMIADYCAKRGAKKDSIEFLILAGQREEAFNIAERNDDMDEYA